MKEDKPFQENTVFTQTEIETTYPEEEENTIVLQKHILGNAFDFITKFYKTVPSKLYFSSNEQHSNISFNIVKDEPVSMKVTYNDLPTNIHLYILSFLDVVTLCRSSGVCRAWDNLANDDLLWENKLKSDCFKWEMIDHLSHPDLYKETDPELTAKKIYLRCCPECRHRRKMGIQFPTQIPNLSYFFGFSIPRIVMFGSGLDSNNLVKRVLWDKLSPFSVKGMFPGQFEGIGSGVTLQYAGGSMNLITLYALPKAERMLQDAHGERKSKLLEADNEADKHVLTIKQPVKELCRTINAFIYIVDGTDTYRVTYGIEEFRAMIDDRWLQPKVPVLILCVVPNATIPSVSSLEVANKLNLLNLSRPWQVRQCHVNSLYGFMPGVTWLNKHIMSL